MWVWKTNDITISRASEWIKKCDYVIKCTWNYLLDYCYCWHWGVKWAKDYGTNHQFFIEEYYEGMTYYVKNEDGDMTRRVFYDKKGQVIEDEVFLVGLNKSTREVYEYNKRDSWFVKRYILIQKRKKPLHTNIQLLTIMGIGLRNMCSKTII